MDKTDTTFEQFAHAQAILAILERERKLDSCSDKHGRDKSEEVGIKHDSQQSRTPRTAAVETRN